MNDAVKRLKTRGALGRKKGAGQKASENWRADIEQVRDLIQSGPCFSSGDIRRGPGFGKTSMRRALKRVLHMKPLRMTIPRKIRELNTARRLAARQPWQAEMEANLKLDPRRASSADEKAQLLVGRGQAPRLGRQQGDLILKCDKKQGTPVGRRARRRPKLPGTGRRDDEKARTAP